MTEKNREEILTEVEALQAIKPRVRQFTYFGDNNHFAIEAQIDALTLIADGAGEDEVMESVEYDRNNIVDAVREAWNWATGQWDDTDVACPSEGWASLAR